MEDGHAFLGSVPNSKPILELALCRFDTQNRKWTFPLAVPRVPRLQKMVGGAAPDARPPVG